MMVGGKRQIELGEDAGGERLQRGQHAPTWSNLARWPQGRATATQQLEPGMVHPARRPAVRTIAVQAATTIVAGMESLRHDLSRVIAPERVLTRPIELAAFASDASLYRLVPQAVVLADGVREIQWLFQFSHTIGIPLTFRSAGTSLSGQAVGDGVLVEVARHWRGVSVLDDGARVRVRPGTIGAQVNLALRRYQRRMGPDPASINAATVGGILANNSSGMCCGVAHNAYHTMESLTFVLPSGTVIDTATHDADELLWANEPALAEGLLDIKRQIEADPELSALIRTKYLLKNTTGYGINAFLDYHRAVDILAHLLIGSEGTLAFIAEAVLRTVPDPAHKATALLLFPDLQAACTAVMALRDCGAQALELMDSAALSTAQANPDGAVALLAEFAASSTDELASQETAAEQMGYKAFTRDPDERARLWAVRKGLAAAVGAVRPSGTTCLLEDIAVPVGKLASAVGDLRDIFARHGYHDAVIFGHAKDGNLHFMLNVSFTNPIEVVRYDLFLRDVVHLVADVYGGSLKAEHGTGRNMAPFVEAEWGKTATALMREIKRLADPHRLLNPGVLISDSPTAHIEHLKPQPTIDAEVDRCTECGFCEHVCPSREFTLTPRQRIVVRRATALASGSERRELERAFRHDGVDTCAADGICSLACPVGINTGALVKRLRSERHSGIAERAGRVLAANFRVVEAVGRVALRAGHAFPALAKRAPMWIPSMPHPARRLSKTVVPDGIAAVYLPACINRIFGTSRELSLPQAFLALAERAGVPLWIPNNAAGTCCGTPWSSKGFTQGHELAVASLRKRAAAWTRNGQLPLVIDASSCAHALAGQIPVIDALDFTYERLLLALTVTERVRSAVTHPSCATQLASSTKALSGIAHAIAETVVAPDVAACCGMAGDRGLLHPELIAKANQGNVPTPADLYLSGNRTCEIALTHVTGRGFEHAILALERATRPGK